MAGRSVRVPWEDIVVEAWLPDSVADLEPDLSISTVRRTEQAAAAVQRIGDRTTGPMEVAARLLLRAEGLASSAIEGLRVTAAEVALAEVAGDSPADDTAAWVADNLAVVHDALRDNRRVDARLVRGWHRRLMRHATNLDQSLVGAWRDRLGWVGGTNPLVAAYVAAPHEAIDELMEDLFVFAARTDVDPITQAAVSHAQFETIHPFADGNGRIGRVLVGRILAHRLAVPVPPPVSTQFERDIGGYLSGLTLYRQGHLDTWIRWFADAVGTAASLSGEVLDAVARLRDRWRASVGDLRLDSTARALVEQLVAHPVLNAKQAAELCGVSEQAARAALGQLSERGVLAETTGASGPLGRPPRWFVARQLLSLLGV